MVPCEENGELDSARKTIGVSRSGMLFQSYVNEVDRFLDQKEQRKVSVHRLKFKYTDGKCCACQASFSIKAYVESDLFSPTY